MNLVTKMLSFFAALPAEDRVECVLPRRHPVVVVVAAARRPELLLAVTDDVADDGAAVRAATAAARVGEVHDGAGEAGLGRLVLCYRPEVGPQATPVVIPVEEVI